MTLMNSIHYFENNNFLYGETFVYQFVMIILSFINNYFGFENQYFYNIVFENYDYIGGTFWLAPIYGNFGFILGGLFIYSYITLIKKLVLAKREWFV